MPTHEGSILTAPGPSTRTLPSTNAATSELVVPKSIPIIRSLIRRHTPWAPRHPDLRRAVHRAIPFISGPVDREHGPLRSIESFLYVHRAHRTRIEDLALTLDRPDLESSQQIVQRLPICRPRARSPPEHREFPLRPPRSSNADRRPRPYTRSPGPRIEPANRPATSGSTGSPGPWHPPLRAHAGSVPNACERRDPRKPAALFRALRRLRRRAAGAREVPAGRRALPCGCWPRDRAPRYR